MKELKTKTIKELTDLMASQRKKGLNPFLKARARGKDRVRIEFE